VTNAPNTNRPDLRLILWAPALLAALALAYFQWRTSSARPLRGSAAVAEQQLKYSLPRSAENASDAKVAIPDLGVPAPRILWRPYPSDAPFTVVFFGPEPIGKKKMMTANLPAQPPLGMLEYAIEAANVPIPDDDSTVILHFKGPIPKLALFSHVALVFLALTTSIRTGLGALTGRDEKALPWATLGLTLVGGAVLGAFVHKAAYGAFWADSDMSGGKTLAMLIVWLAACLLAGFPKIRRPALVLASLLTIVAFLIPHSLQASKLKHQSQQDTVQTDPFVASSQ
jgi:hypothetical protein